MTPGGIAILTTCGVILAALIAAIVELRKTRASAGRVEHEVTPNGGASLRDAVNRIASRVDSLHTKLDDHSQRLVRVETRTESWHENAPRRRATDV
jgi:hypothetical protein